MSYNKNESSKSLNDFTSDIILKTNLFFKSFTELTPQNLDNYLECIGLIDIWNTEEEKNFLWNSFYKYNIKGKVIESSVIKGLKEILNKEDTKNSMISLNEKKEDYSSDNNNIKLSFDKMRSSFIIKSSLNNLIMDKKGESLDNYINKCDAIKLKQIRNIMILLNYNNIDKYHFVVNLSQIKDILNNYSLLSLSIEDFINYLSNISEKKLNKSEEEFIINKDLYNLSIKLIENKIKKFEKESVINENFESSNSNNSIFDSNLSDSKNELEEKIKKYIENIININNDFKLNINILKDLENTMKGTYIDIISNFKNLLSFKNNNENKNNYIIKITDNDDKYEDEIKINIENDISYMNKKYDEVDIFIKEIENNIIQYDNRIKNLNILINKLIGVKIDLENENNRILISKKEAEENTNIHFNLADEEINKLSEENNILQNKLTELSEQIESLKLDNKNNKDKINKLEDDHEIKTKELKEKNDEINKLKLEYQDYKNKYDSLLDQFIKINNNKETDIQKYEYQLILIAKNNLLKRKNFDQNFININNLNIEQILEQNFNLQEKNNINIKNIEEKENIIYQKDKKIKQLEIDLELYREKMLSLSQENKTLKDLKDFNNNKNIDRKTFTLNDLVISKNSLIINDNNNEFSVFSNHNEIKNLKNTTSGNLVAPPCSIMNEGNFLTNDGNSINMEINKGEKNIEKKYINTPNELNKKERSSNPFVEESNERLSNPFKNKNENKKDINNVNNNMIESNQNLNINEEFIKNNEPEQNNLINNNDNNNIIIDVNNSNFQNQSNNILNIKNIEKSFSSKEMNDILIKNNENKIPNESYDYLYLFTNIKIQEIFKAIGENYTLKDIFSDIIYLLDEYEQLYKCILFITKKCLYIIEPETYQIKYTFVRTILIRCTLSSINCNILVFHFTMGNDLVLMTLRRPKLISFFVQNSEKNKSDIKFKYTDEFNVKKNGRYYSQKIKHSMNSTTFNFQTAIKLGYLIKINEGYIFNQFHEKLVVLTDFGLFYFDNPTLPPKKLISIIGAEINDLKNKFGDKLYSFEIQTLNGYKIILGSNCKEEYQDWLKILINIKNKYDKNEVIG